MSYFQPDYIDFDFKAVEEAISKHFIILDSYILDNRYVFEISTVEDNLKNKFVELKKELKELGNYIPFMDKHGEKIIITVFKRIEHKEDKRRPIILFVATLATILIDGYLRSNSPIYSDILGNYNPWYMTILFTIALLGIIGVHELGHKLVLLKYGVEASWPNFIPGIPGIFPTFGAIITQREPPTNRDELFDIGLAGPLFGLLVTIIVSFYAAATAPVISLDKLHVLDAKYGKAQAFPVPILYILIQNIVKPLHPGEVIIVNPLVWAAVVGFILTGLNLLPAWQLDGGHLARATVGPKYHRISTILSVIALFVLGYWAMALLIAFLYFISGGASARPLDDVSKLSNSRKIIFIISLILAFLCLPPGF